MHSRTSNTPLASNAKHAPDTTQDGATTHIFDPEGPEALDLQRYPFRSENLRTYLRQQISEAANAEERADAVRLAQRLARA